MGLIRLARGMSRPIRGAARTMNARHVAVVQHLLARNRRPAIETEEVPTIGGGLSLEDDSGLWFPDDVNQAQLSSYPCDEFSGDKPYTDQYRVLNQNPVTVTANPIQLALENRRRASLFIVNVSTSSILIGFGFAPTTTVYTLPLQACGSVNDGTGGIIIDEIWRGTVWAILAAGAPNGALLFTELPDSDTAS
jgi:hypothetical protein